MAITDQAEFNSYLAGSRTDGLDGGGINSSLDRNVWAIFPTASDIFETGRYTMSDSPTLRKLSEIWMSQIAQMLGQGNLSATLNNAIGDLFEKASTNPTGYARVRTALYGLLASWLSTPDATTILTNLMWQIMGSGEFRTFLLSFIRNEFNNIMGDYQDAKANEPPANPTETRAREFVRYKGVAYGDSQGRLGGHNLATRDDVFNMFFNAFGKKGFRNKL